MGVGLGSAGVKLDRSWAQAGRGLKQNLAQAELEISWDGLGIILAELKLGLLPAHPLWPYWWPDQNPS